MKEMKKYNSDTFSQHSDAKFLAIPFFFLLLHAGSIAVSILYVYTKAYVNMNHTLQHIVLYWMVSLYSIYTIISLLFGLNQKIHYYTGSMVLIKWFWLLLWIS